jgi:flagellin
MAVTSLSSGVRAALSSLNATAATSQQGQLRLATGKKVNSAIDSPVNFFTAAGLNDRAAQLTENLDGISNGIQTIQAASKGIDAITKLITSLQSTVKQAQADAAANRPKAAGTVAIGGGAVGTKNAKDVALNAELGGTAAAATASADAKLGVTGAVLAVTIKAGNTTYTDDSLTATSTVRDLVNSINNSGIATASVDDSGKLTVTGSGSDTLQFGIGGGADAAAALTNAQAATQNTAIGLLATDYTTGQSASGNSAIRSNLVDQFNSLRDQIDSLAKDAGFNGTNLLAGDKLSVTFNEKTGTAKNKLDVQGSTTTAANLGIVKAGTADAAGVSFNIQSDTSLASAADSLTASLSSLRSMSSSLGANLSIVQTRQDFTKDLVNTLTQGADNLTLADTNEEGAKLLALQTRQQLSQTALTLSNQADQAVLRLF